MFEINRRRFLDRTRKTTLGLAGGVTILANPGSVRATPANDRLVLAMIGVGGGRGHSLAMGFLDRGDCEIGYICDVNRQLHEPRAKEYAARQGGKRPKCVQDFREMLEDASVDAVVIATPPHWHALATILCCRAGKDVYCEKPQSHNCWEGRQAVKAARKYDRIVQIGTQNRSAPYNLAAKRYLEEGKLGRVHLCRVFEQSLRGRLSSGAPTPTRPTTLDWDMWNGPAPARKYNKAIHIQWRQLWDYAGGADVLPGDPPDRSGPMALRRRLSEQRLLHGRAFRPQGDAETPDTQLAVFEFPEMLMTYEQTLVHALHAQERPRDSQRRHLPPLAAERHADRALRREGRDVRGPDGRRLAGLRPHQRADSRWSRTRCTAASPTRTTRRTSSSRSRAASGPTPTSKKVTAACSWSTTPTSVAGSAAGSCKSTRRPSRSSTIPRPWSSSSESTASRGWSRRSV